MMTSKNIFTGMVRLVGTDRNLDGLRPPLVFLGSSTRGLGFKEETESESSRLEEGLFETQFSRLVSMGLILHQIN